MLHSIIHKLTHFLGEAGHAHGSTVHSAAANSGPLPDPAGHLGHLPHKAVVHSCLDEEALSACTVLAAAEEGALHGHWDGLQQASQPGISIASSMCLYCWLALHQADALPEACVYVTAWVCTRQVSLVLGSRTARSMQVSILLVESATGKSKP